jgi:hypothetical protein
MGKLISFSYSVIPIIYKTNSMSTPNNVAIMNDILRLQKKCGKKRKKLRMKIENRKSRIE